MIRLGIDIPCMDPSGLGDEVERRHATPQETAMWGKFPMNGVPFGPVLNGQVL